MPEAASRLIERLPGVLLVGIVMELDTPGFVHVTTRMRLPALS